MNEIKSIQGRVVGQWDGKQLAELKNELKRIKEEMAQEGANDRVCAGWHSAPRSVSRRVE